MLCAPGVEQSVDESVPLRVLGGIGGDPVEQVGGDHSRKGIILPLGAPVDPHHLNWIESTTK